MARFCAAAFDVGDLLGQVAVADAAVVVDVLRELDHFTSIRLGILKDIIVVEFDVV